jgi:hypothetical protein
MLLRRPQDLSRYQLADSMPPAFPQPTQKSSQWRQHQQPRCEILLASGSQAVNTAAQSIHPFENVLPDLAGAIVGALTVFGDDAI